MRDSISVCDGGNGRLLARNALSSHGGRAQRGPGRSLPGQWRQDSVARMDHHREKRRAEERLISIKVMHPQRGACGVPKKVPDETLIQIEETQAALRDSIEQAK